MKALIFATCIAICTPATAGKPTQADQKPLRWTIEVSDTASDGSKPEHVVTWYDVGEGERVRSGVLTESRKDIEGAIGMEIVSRSGHRFLQVELGVLPSTPDLPRVRRASNTTFEMILDDKPGVSSTGSHSIEPTEGSLLVRRTYVATPSSRGI